MKQLKDDVDTFNNLVFEKRNREYGAYAIRASYNLNAIKSTLITGGSFLALMFLLYSFSGTTKFADVKNPDFMTQTICTIRPIDIPEPQPVKEETHVAKAAPNTTPVPVISNAATDNGTALKPNDSDNMNTGNSTDPNSNGTAVKGDTSGRQPEVVTYVEPPQEPKQPERWVDEMPAFNGDIARFIQGNISYPEEAIIVGTEGVVYLQFVVNEDGSISNPKVLKGIGSGCDEEAIKVVSKMPKWKAGKNHGMPVKVYFNLPIRFKFAH